MSKNRFSPSVLVRLACIAALTVVTTGCPSSDEEAPEPVQAPPAPVQPNPLRPDAESEAKRHASDKLKPLPGKHSGKPFDPIKENGPIFDGWPANVKLALVITGRQEGYIEPCGCAGLDRMKGGMSRRHTLFKQLRAKGWPVVGIDVGGLAKGYGLQAELKFHTMVDGMKKMGYQAIALGTSELRLQTGELASEAAIPSPFLSANVALFGFEANITGKTRIVEKAGMKLGITGVLGKRFQREVKNPEVQMIDPEAALEKVVPQLKQQADYLILLAHATMEESLALARKFPDFDLVVTAGGGAVPPSTPTPVPGTKALLIEVGEKGMDAIVLAIYDDPEKPRYQLVPLDSRFPGSADMELLMEMYQDELRRSFHRLGFPVGEQALPHPQRELGGRFVGSKECQSCHEESYRIWKKSGHAKAYETLAELKPVRSFDPECLSCHVIGWDPREHFPYRSGYQSLKGTAALKATPELIHVGCESCHGPGSAHVKAEMGADLALQEKLQQAVRVTKAEAEEKLCRECHDGDNSPDFDFELYWPHVEHYEDE